MMDDVLVETTDKMAKAVSHTSAGILPVGTVHFGVWVAMSIAISWSLSCNEE